MTRFSVLSLALFMLAAVAVPGAFASDQNLSTKVALQAAMQRHVDASLVDGAILYLDTDSGEVRKMHPVTAHPIILTMGDHYVLCFDFRDDAGKNLHIDYYMAQRGNEYVVFHTAVADHDMLDGLMKAGKVKRFR